MSYHVTAHLEPFILGCDQYCLVFSKDDAGETNQFIVDRFGEILDSGELETVPEDLLQLVKQSAKEQFDKNPNSLATVENLLVWTHHFFERHWNLPLIGIKPPKWSEPTPVKEPFPPNGNKQGVYAFVKGNIVTYIGVGTSKGSGLYRGHGIGKRFQSYAKYVDGQYQAVDERLKEAGRAMTIGFEIEEAYLANALELFLIAKLNPKYNSNHPGS